MSRSEPTQTGEPGGSGRSGEPGGQSRLSGDALVERIRAGVIGDDAVIDTPYGARRVVYADYTASGRALDLVEDFIRDQVLPLYANTHTEASSTGLQTSRWREQARGLVADAVGAGEDCAVIFTGSGTTAAIDKLVGILGLRVPSALQDRYPGTASIAEHERPVVFVGPYEHHSNELPWRESICDVVVIGQDGDGHIDLDRLEAELLRYADRPLRIGAFSAASNVTGILSDTAAIADLLHAHDALSFFDFAAAAPYVDIDMGTPGGHYFDAIFLSPHKFVGGPGTPGVLVVRRELLTNRVPVVPGGGTVAYVNTTEHRYLSDAVHREEGGTPAIVESIRAGLVFDLKQSVGVPTIRNHEQRLLDAALSRWAGIEQLEILGSLAVDRLPIVSFVIRSPGGRYLHHNFVVAVLNDVFGIQSRGGCSCAGPYGHHLLGIDDQTSRDFEREIVCHGEGIKPGWTRINFNYFVSEEVARYLTDAVALIATDGWRLLPDYRFEPIAGLWRHRSGGGTPARSLGHWRDQVDRPPTRPGPDDSVLAGYLDQARRIMAAAGDVQGRQASVSPEFDALRWFDLPEESLLRV